ncbi:MAG: hypothetical protein J5525_02740 [Lachnospiraceae bacterium]|nr:hypothetical protein [Lachnospiraceae bacterium]
MKIYNIENTKEFFETLSECEGNVELVNDNGEHITLSNKNGENLNLLSETYVDGSIKEIELSFSDKTDAVRMFTYLSGMHNVA